MAKKLKWNQKHSLISTSIVVVSLFLVVLLWARLNFTWINHFVIQGIFNAISYSTQELSTLKYIEKLLSLVGRYSYIGFSICFLWWFYYCFKKVKQNDKALVEPAFWSVLMWFVPLLNLMIPLALVKRMFEASYRILDKNNIEYKVYKFWLLDLWWMSLICYLSLEILQYFTLEVISIIGLSWLLIAKYTFAFIFSCLWYSWIVNYVGISEKLKKALYLDSIESDVVQQTQNTQAQD